MAATEVQNSQRGAIFLWTLNLIVLNAIQNKVQLVGQSGKQDKYKADDQAQQPAPEGSGEAFDKPAIKSTIISQDDTMFDKVIKRTYDYEVFYQPLLMIFAFNLVTGNLKAFAVSLYFIVTFFALIFNVFKLHRSLGIQHKAIRIGLESLWLIGLFFFFVNQYAVSTILQPYVVVSQQ